MHRTTLSALAAVVFPLCTSAGASPAPAGDDDRADYLTLYFENDLFGSNDRDYTGGFRLSWISGERDVTELGRIQRNLRRFSGDDASFSLFRNVTNFEDPAAVRYNYGFSVTQLMFTPDDGQLPNQPPGQRRYAGWLGLGFSLHVKDERILNSIELTLGTIGPNALAEEAQDLIHDLLDNEKFQGWDDQVPNEFTVDLSFVQKRRADFLTRGAGAVRMDGITEWGVRLGTFRTDAHFGGMMRWGYNLPPDFSDPRLSATAYSHRYFGDGRGYFGNWSVYALFGANVRGVLHDATLDGPLFRSFDTGNEREPFVAEVYAGFGIRYRALEFSYVHTLRTKEYEEQNGTSALGSIAIRMRF